MSLTRPPRALIAPCSFKGSLSPSQAARAISRGFTSAIPDASLDLCPLADGGEGTLSVLADCLGAELLRATVRDPLGRATTAQWGWLAEKRTAIIESAQAVGLPLVASHLRDPMRATSHGVAELVQAALDAKARTIWVGLGGSATVDGGVGMLQALGARFFDTANVEIPRRRLTLTWAQSVDLSGLDPRLAEVELLALCDIGGPLLGQRGARLYMPQKGASAAQCDELEWGLKRLADTLQRETGRDVSACSGAGAAGGLGSAFAALGARLVSGTSFVFEAVEIRRRLADCDWVFGGEGRIDEQTLEGKPILALARLAKELDKPFVAMCGSRAGNLAELHGEGLTAALTILPGPTDEGGALNTAADNLERSTYEAARMGFRLRT